MNQDIQEAPEGRASPSEDRKKARKKWAFRIITLIIIILLLLLLLHRCGYIGSKNRDNPGYIIGAGVKEGQMSTGGTEDNTDKSSNGTETMRVKINGNPMFTDGKSEGSLEIENPAENALYMEVEITLDDTGEVIYDSGAIPPNHYIDNDKLAKVLKKGEYTATAHVTLFDPDDPDAQYNSANFSLTITIKD